MLRSSDDTTAILAPARLVCPLDIAPLASTIRPAGPTYRSATPRGSPSISRSTYVLL
jgi:hypothetical protein